MTVPVAKGPRGSMTDVEMRRRWAMYARRAIGKARRGLGEGGAGADAFARATDIRGRGAGEEARRGGMMLGDR